MPSLATLVFLSLSVFSPALALFADGTINNNDWELTYDSTTYGGTTANSTLLFCTAFRAECISYVGAINYHHGLDCVVTQEGPNIYGRCSGIEKTSTGDTGDGPSYDFTSIVCPLVSGCTLAAEPVNATTPYGETASTTAAVASSTTSDISPAEAETSVTSSTTTSATTTSASSSSAAKSSSSSTSNTSSGSTNQLVSAAAVSGSSSTSNFSSAAASSSSSDTSSAGSALVASIGGIAVGLVGVLVASLV